MAGNVMFYYRNYSSSDTTNNSDYTSSHIAPDIETLGWSPPEGYLFKEWNSQQDGSGTSFQPNERPVFPSPDDVRAYAIWEQDSLYIAYSSEFKSIANAIRTKGNISTSLAFPNGFVNAISAISTGGSGSSGYTIDDIAMRTMMSGEISGNASFIASYAFYNCSNLTTVSFPSCTSIGIYAFGLCSSLTAANFPSCTSIGHSAFYSCRSLTTIDFSICKSIGSSAFYYCSKLTTASFPSCEYIYSNAFYNCTSLTTLSFPLCKSMWGYAFYSCSNLTTASFPSCTSIGAYAFYNCFNLTTVNFPLCTSIGSSAFYNCRSFTTINFPLCTSIGSYAFCSCSNLTAASFPSCISVGSNAFYNCSNLTTASFPLCTSIGNSVFRNCYKFISLYLTNVNKVPTLGGTSVFTSTPIGGYSASAGQYGSVYVPSSLYASFLTASYWSAISNRIVSV